MYGVAPPKFIPRVIGRVQQANTAMLSLPNLSRLSATTAHDGEFKELSDDELEAMSEEALEKYRRHKAKHDAKKKAPAAKPRRGG